MLTHKIGFGFCSHVAKGSDRLSEVEPVVNLVLLPHWRVRGFACALTTGLIKTLYVMGKPWETNAYREHIIKEGGDPNQVKCLHTEQSTQGNARDMWAFLEEHHVPPDEWALLTSDYHLPRARLTAEVLHNVVIRHAYGTESILYDKAYREGGQSRQELLMKEFLSSVDPIAYALRIQHETKGCSVLRVNPSDYKPRKG